MQRNDRTLRTVGMTIAAFGKSFDDSTIAQIKRAKGMKMNILTEPKVAHELQGVVKTYSDLAVGGNFTEEIASAVKTFSKSGVPSYLGLAITMDVYNEEAMIAVGIKHPVHIVFVNESKTNNTVKNITSAIDVFETVPFNQIDALTKGVQGGRIIVTNAKELEMVLDTLEASNGQISQEVYKNLTTSSWTKAGTTLESLWQKFTNSITPFVKTAKEKLKSYRKVTA